MAEQRHQGKTAEEWGMTPEHFDRWREEIDPGDGSSLLQPTAVSVKAALDGGTWSREELVAQVRDWRDEDALLGDDEYEKIVAVLPDVASE